MRADEARRVLPDYDGGSIVNVAASVLDAFGVEPPSAPLRPELLPSGGLAGPDGMALDAEGNLAVAHAGLGTVWLFSPLGEPLARIRSCEGVMTTNVAYGGPSRKTLYITESQSGTILAADMPAPGKAMFGEE